jgi:hypothetical protein
VVASQARVCRSVAAGSNFARGARIRCRAAIEPAASTRGQAKREAEIRAGLDGVIPAGADPPGAAGPVNEVPPGCFEAALVRLNGMRSIKHLKSGVWPREPVHTYHDFKEFRGTLLTRGGRPASVGDQ